MRLGSSTWPKEREDELKRLWKRGITLAQIGADLGVSAEAARSRAQRIGLPNRMWGVPLKWLDAHVSFAGDECLIWPFAINNHGYPGAIRYNGARSRSAINVMTEKAHGPPPSPTHESRHSCGNGKNGCINPRHLSWGTHLENMSDKILHGTHNRGSRNWSSKLNEEQVLEIRALEGSMSRRLIGKKFGVSKGAVQSIHNRSKWQWLT